MDCSLAFAAVDLVKRPYFKIDLKLRGKKVEEMPTEDIVHFFESLATALQANVHMFVEYGSNDHHKAEAATKALALSLTPSNSHGSQTQRCTQLQRSHLMPQAVIFDYGVGNLLSLKTALEKAGLTASIGTTAKDLAKADAIALPGVGSFTAASDKLRRGQRNPSN